MLGASKKWGNLNNSVAYILKTTIVLPNPRIPVFSRTILLLSAIFVLFPPLVLAQPMAEEDNIFRARTVSAVRTSDAPSIDGTILGEAVWQQAELIEGFVQTTPNDGDAATEKTEVRILFDNEYFYVGVVCYHNDPDQIIVSEATRDGSLLNIDSFQFVLDTFKDTQNGFVFGTSPAGIEYDAQISNEGGGQFGAAGAQAGSGGGLNVNWDGAWEVKSSIDANGWSAEFAIPFKTLRFPRNEIQDWGINFQRNIRYNNEIAYWSPLPRQFNLYRVSLAGTLQNVEVPETRNLKIMPYALGQTAVIGERDLLVNPDLDRNSQNGDFGLDVKYSITPSMALDLTYNTDFAQVEVDEQQINLDRFTLFFPEKRPFFLENAGIFSISADGTVQTGSDVELFFSRRIGIGPNGQAVPIIGGARVSGTIGRNSSLGLLNMQTESINGVTESNNFSVARFEQRLKNRSSVGVMFVNREGSDNLTDSLDNRYNRLIGVNGKLGIGLNSEIAGYFARTFSPDDMVNQDFDDGKEYALDVKAERSTEALLLNAQYSEVRGNFNPEVGFLSRRNFKKFSALVFNTIRVEDFFNLLEIRPHISYRGYWGVGDNFQETGYTHIDTHWEWRTGFEVHTGFNIRKEGVRNGFRISDGITVPAGTYDWVEGQFVVYTNPGKPVSFRLRTFVGGFFGGDRVSNSATLSARYGEKLNLEFALQRNDVNLPAGDFVSNLFRTRVSYAFTPRIFLQSLLQYNDQAELWSTNIRFGWLQSANTGLFIVFNQVSYLDIIDDPGIFYGFGDLSNRSLTVKYTYLFDVFR